MPKIDDKHTDIVWSRVDAVVNLILENDRYLHSKRNKELCKTVMDKFSLAERTAYRYVAEAKKEIRKIGQRDKEKAFIQAIRDREFLFQKAKQVERDEKGRAIGFPDYKLALEVVKDRDKLQGLYVDEVNLNGTVTNKIDLAGITTEDIKTLIDGLKKTNTTSS